MTNESLKTCITLLDRDLRKAEDRITKLEKAIVRGTRTKGGRVEMTPTGTPVAGAPRTDSGTLK